MTPDKTPKGYELEEHYVCSFCRGCYFEDIEAAIDCCKDEKINEK